MARQTRRPRTRHWLGLWCAAAAGCTPLSDLDGYSSGGSGFASAPGDSRRPAADLDSGSALPALDGGAREPDEQASPLDAGRDDPPDPRDASPHDTLAPAVARTTPEDGESGVRREASLVITFSEPMDQASVEAAFVSGTLGGAEEFQWASGGEQLTILPATPLSYATGTDLSQLAALTYEYRITSAARDLAGNALPELVVSFSTLRQIEVVASAQADASLSGNWRSDGTYGTDSCAQAGPSTCIGDSSFGPNASYRGFTSFDLSFLPSSPIELTHATLDIEVTSTLGAPFAGLGALLLEHVSFSEVGPEAFTAAATASLGAVSSAQSGTLSSFDVLEALRADRQGARSQYRFRFESASDGDGAADLVFARRASAALRATYLVP